MRGSYRDSGPTGIFSTKGERFGLPLDGEAPESDVRHFRFGKNGQVHRLSKRLPGDAWFAPKPEQTTCGRRTSQTSGEYLDAAHPVTCKDCLKLLGGER